MGTDASIGLRLEMWKTSLDAIRQAPVFGHGSMYLQHLIAEKYGFEHNHNQYLSWLVTGGILLLGLGLWLLLTPWILAAGLPITERLIITLSITMVWGISMMFDSFLNMKFYLHYYCLLIGLLYALINDMLAQNYRIKG
jgi:O-antigen ligase